MKVFEPDGDGGTRNVHARASSRVQVAWIVFHAFVISTGLALIAATLSAAIAFAARTTIIIPLVATFRGFTDAAGSPAMTMTGSWITAAIVLIALAVMISALIITASRRKEIRRSGS